MTSQQVLPVALCLYGPLLAATAFFTRATWRRFLGALAGGVTVAVVGVGVEILAHTFGIWRYPSTDQPYGPLLMYPLGVMVFTLLALLGWRTMRRFGWRGEIVFLTSLVVIATLRDFLTAGKVGFIVFAPGPLTVLVDAACWIAMTALAQVMMRVVAGPADSDRLARQR